MAAIKRGGTGAAQTLLEACGEWHALWWALDMPTIDIENVRAYLQLLDFTIASYHVF